MIWLFALLIQFPAFAASCCGGSLSAPALILGDEQRTLTTTFAQREILEDVDTNGIWRKNQNHEHVQNLKIDFATLFADRWQAGLSLPLIRKSKQFNAEENSKTGLGDLVLTLGYEALPEWEYSDWKPRGYLFTTLTAPTGKSLYETQGNTLDVRGRGFWALGVGAAFTKRWGLIDAITQLEIHRSLPKSATDPGGAGQLQLKPGFGSSWLLGAGYSLKEFRFGLELSGRTEQATAVSGAQTSTGSAERDVTASAIVGYLFNDNLAGRLSFSEQRLFGSPLNTSLGQIVSLSIQNRWAR